MEVTTEGGLITPPGNPCGLHGLHGRSTDSTDSILAVDTPKFCFHSPRTVHGQSVDCYDFYNFHGIHADSPWTPHGLSPWIPWTIPDGFYGILRDLIRVLINVIKCNLIPLYYI